MNGNFNKILAKALDEEHKREQQNYCTDEPWVRCKDCKYLNGDVTAKGKPLYGCDRMYDELGCEQEVELDDFCSWGVRKDDD